MAVHAKVNRSLPFIPKFKQEKRPRWHGALTNRKDEALGAFKIQIIDSPCKYYLYEHEVLSGTWFSTL